MALFTKKFPDGFRNSSLRHLALLGLFLGGCSTYQSKPLTSDAVQSRLQPPDEAVLRIQAEEIKHPILQPIKLNPEEGLTPDSAAVLAVLLNPALRAVRDQREQARAQMLDAGILPNPELGFGVEFPKGDNTTGSVNAYGLELNWEISALISRSAKIDEARARQQAVELDIAWQEWQTAQAARNAVYQLASLQRQTQLAKKSARELDQISKRLRNAVENGAATAASLVQFQADSLQAHETLLALRKQAARKRFQLNRLMGLPAQSPIHLQPSIDLPIQVNLPSNKTLLNNLEQRRLDLLALRRGYDSQEEAVRAAVLQQFPKIGLGPTLHRDTDGVRTIGFGLNIELPIFNRNQGKVAAERATRQMLFDEYANRLFNAQSDVAEIRSGIHFLNRQIAAAQAAAENLTELEKKDRVALTDGRIDAAAYATPRTEQVRAQIQVLDLQAQLAQAVTALQLAAGLYEIPEPITLNGKKSS